MAVYCFTQAIQHGKHEEARAIFQETQRDHREEYEASRRRSTSNGGSRKRMSRRAEEVSVFSIRDSMPEARNPDPP
jgi:hypothetical protein